MFGFCFLFCRLPLSSICYNIPIYSMLCCWCRCYFHVLRSLAWCVWMRARWNAIDISCYTIVTCFFFCSLPPAHVAFHTLIVSFIPSILRVAIRTFPVAISIVPPPPSPSDHQPCYSNMHLVEIFQN